VTELMRPDRRALLELDSLLGQVELLHRSGSRARFDADRIYRWALHRLWIAAGNEALRDVSAIGRDIHTVQPWARLYQRRKRAGAPTPGRDR
jgi:hypothetical protein